MPVASSVEAIRFLLTIQINQEIIHDRERLVLLGDEDVMMGRIELDDAGRRRCPAKSSGSLPYPGPQLFAERDGNLPGNVFLANGLVEAYLTMSEHAKDETRQAWLKKAGAVIRRMSKRTRDNQFSLPEQLMLWGAMNG